MSSSVQGQIQTMHNFMHSHNQVPITLGSNQIEFYDNMLNSNEKYLGQQGWKEVNLFNKYDSDKAQWHLMPWDIIKDVVEVLTSGEKKYPGENWKKCTDKNRYLNALDRHICPWRLNDRIDPESRKSHLVHAICNLLFLAALEKEGKI